MAFTVSAVARYIRSIIENDAYLSDIEVEGELSNITRHSSGHIYFTLKEGVSVLSGVMFKSATSGLTFRPNTGDKVVVKGRITAYEARGQYQIVAVSIKRAGEGPLYKRFLELKAELSEMGMFDEIYKRPIPKYIKTLGIVTSPTGAAKGDIIRVATRRNPYVQIILYPALVQGDGAAESIAAGIETMDAMGLDVLIVGRGGGSMEDLWAFNERIVAEAIFACSTPVISAVGHEQDFSISDFVADLRAATPTDAAVLAVYEVWDVIEGIEDGYRKLNNNMQWAIDAKRQMALDMERRIRLLSPSRRILQDRERLKRSAEKLSDAMNLGILMSRQRLGRISGALHALSPAARLSQGYSYITDKEGRNIKHASQLSPGDEIRARLARGEITAKVQEITED